LPFILITGALSEEQAAEMIKAGATDFLLKDRLSQLVPAVIRAVREGEQRAARRQAEANYQSIFENALEGIFLSTPQGRLLSANPSLASMLGYTSPEELISGITDLERQLWVKPESRRDLVRRLEQDGSVQDFENEMYRKDGRRIWVRINARAVHDHSGALLFQGSCLDVTERKQLEREVLEASSNERRRIGHDLHDGLCQYLSGIAFRAKALEQSLAASGLAQAGEAKELASLLSNAITQSRALARGLDPVDVETRGLPAALQNLAAETSKLFDIDCSVDTPILPLVLPPQSGLALYRIAQEAIHNALTHGHPQRIHLVLNLQGEELLLRIQDDGRGFEVSQQSSGAGMGLRVMQYRARSIGATLTIHSERSKGTEISCRLKFAAQPVM